MTILPRAATAGELTKLRSDNQSTRLYLTIHSPATVYTARLQDVPTSNDQVASITYNSGSGTLANVLQDMTLLVGSSAGASDYGIARIRKDGTTTAGTFYIGETSEINWVSNAYLTVLDEFGLWPRHIKMATNGTTPLMDYDVDYVAQNYTAIVPTPIMGPQVVLWLRGATVSYTPDAASSWLIDGTITAYAWTATGASASSGMTTATPTITYNATGTYRIALTVTGNNGVTFTAYRYVFVVTESSGVVTQFNLDNCQGNMQEGGWSFGVTLYAEADQTSVRDRALVILHAVDYYGDTRSSLGYVTNAENIVALGWIAGETITRGADDKYGTVSFDVKGPHYWLGNMTAFPTGVKDVTIAPNKWTKFYTLTLNKALYHWMRWRTTATRCMDVYPNTDTRRHKRLEAPGGETIWAQLTEITRRSILANPACDRYGRFFCEIDQQFVSSRGSMPTVQDITTQDVVGDVKIERTPTDENSLIDLSGIAWDGTTATPYFALAPGHVFNHHGSVEVVDRLMLVDQATTNTLAGLYSAWRNNNYKSVDINFASNHRLFDITPYQRMTYTLTASDTPRSLATTLTLIPRQIAYTHNAQAGYLLTSATLEAEVTADLAITGDTPPTPPQPPIVPVTPPVIPPIDPPVASDADEVWMALNESGTNVWGIVWSGDFFRGGQPTWNKVAALPSGTTNLERFATTLSGGAIYIVAKVSNKRGLWYCTNPKDVAPTWTKLYEVGDSFHGHTIDNNTSFNTLVPHGETVTTGISYNNGTIWLYVMEFTGATAIEYGPFSDTSFGRLVGYRGYVTVSAYYKSVSGSNIGLYNQYDNKSSTPWVNLVGGNHYGALHTTGAVSLAGLFDIETQTKLYTASTSQDAVTFGYGAEHYPRGAWNGTEIDFVNGLGDLYVATDGVTLVQKASWAMGCVEQSKLVGGGPLVWAVKTITANNVPIRISTDLGSNWTDMTGNFWSVVSGGKILLNMQLVFTS